MKAWKVLGWEPKTDFNALVHRMCYHDLYQCLNLYPITARQEGGPQSLIECGLLGVPAVSRDIGMASQVLPASAISDDVTSATPTVPDVSALSLPNGYAAYRKLLEIL